MGKPTHLKIMRDILVDIPTLTLKGIKSLRRQTPIERLTARFLPSVCALVMRPPGAACV